MDFIRYFNNGPAFRATLVAFDAPGDTALTAMPDARWCASASAHQAIISFASAYAVLGEYFTFGPLRMRASAAADMEMRRQNVDAGWRERRSEILEHPALIEPDALVLRRRGDCVPLHFRFWHV